MAAINDHHDVVQALLDAKANVNRQSGRNPSDYWGLYQPQSALVGAVLRGASTHTVQALLHANHAPRHIQRTFCYFLRVHAEFVHVKLLRVGSSPRVATSCANMIAPQ